MAKAAPPKASVAALRRALERILDPREQPKIDRALPIFGFRSGAAAEGWALSRTRLLGWVFGVRLRTAYGVAEVHLVNRKYRFGCLSQDASGSVFLPYLRNQRLRKTNRFTLRLLRAPELDLVGLWRHRPGQDLITLLPALGTAAASDPLSWPEVIAELKQLADVRALHDDRPKRITRKSG